MHTDNEPMVCSPLDRFDFQTNKFLYNKLDIRLKPAIVFMNSIRLMRKVRMPAQNVEIVFVIIEAGGGIAPYIDGLKTPP